MIFGQYNEQSLKENGLTHPVWKQAFEWASTVAPTAENGEHEITGKDLYANIMRIPALPEQDGAFEVHAKYLDIHYCIEGGEAIGFAPLETLQEKTEFDAEKDYQLFAPSGMYSIYRMQKGDFAIFFPRELHMPKLHDDTHQNLNKVVMKITMDLLK